MPHASFLWRAPLVALAATLGCSVVSSVDYAQCSASADCREAFGLGYTCGEAGLCERIDVLERCKTTYPEDLLERPDKYRDVVVLGSLFNHAEVGGDRTLVNAASLAIEEANMTGLAEGRQFAMIHCDYQDKDIGEAIDDLNYIDAALAGTRYLVDQLGAVAIVGPGTSDISEAVYTELAKPEHGDRRLIVSPSATGLSLIDIDTTTPGYFWRTAPPDTVLAVNLAEFMEERTIANAVVLYESGTYGQGLALELDKSFEDQLVPIEYKDPADIPGHVVQIANNNPTAFGVVFLTGDPVHVSAFLNAAGDIPFYDQITIFLGDAGYNADVLAATRDKAADLYDDDGSMDGGAVFGVFPGSPAGPVWDTFRSKYNATFLDKATDASYSAHTYDAAWLAIYGAAWSYYQHDGEIEGRFMAEGLTKISAGDAVNISGTTWSTVKKAFSEGRGIDVRGASGDLNYDPVTEETTAPALRWTVVSDGMGGWDFGEYTP